ncbi:MAG: hypothetical protein M3O61_17315 [Gemmatimonadota bacterium]|nr:hypothetical protein [Gemmatimonadota bacterium]
MYLPDVESHVVVGPHAAVIDQTREFALPIAQIMHLLAFEPDRTMHLDRLGQAMIRHQQGYAAGRRLANQGSAEASTTHG